MASGWQSSTEFDHSLSYVCTRRRQSSGLMHWRTVLFFAMPSKLYVTIKELCELIVMLVGDTTINLFFFERKLRNNNILLVSEVIDRGTDSDGH